MLDEPDVIDAVGRAVASAPVVIADGHHRYETARTYQREVRAANGDRPGPTTWCWPWWWSWPRTS